MTHDHYILEGHEPIPVDLMTWGKWYETIGDGRVLEKTQIGEGLVSTVFLGLDHNWGDKGPPLLFETLVFGGPLADEMERYATWEEAEAGHKAMCERARQASSAS